MELYPHQQKALDDTSQFNRVAYYLDMGLGKTFVGSEKIKQLGNSINIVVCQKSLIPTWMQHFKTHYANHDKDFCCEDLIFDLTNKKQLEKFTSEVKAATETYEICDDLTGETYQQENLYPYLIVGIINYDLLFRRSYFLELEHFTLILDESSMIQNEKAKRSKFVLQMKPDNVVLLSGTPTSGKYENLWTQIHLLGWKITKELYNKQYVNWKKVEIGGFPMSIVDKEEPYKNIDRLKQKLRSNGAIFMKTEDCFELPSQTIIPMMVETSKEYKKFKKSSIITIDTLNLTEFKDDTDFYGEDVTPRVELIGDTTLTKRLYSRMLCGQYSKEKLRTFKDLLLSTQDRLIVFYNFNEELVALKKIADQLEKPISEVSGQVKDLSNYEIEDNSITFIQYQAGAMGLNLQKANKIIYFTLTEKSELFEQSKKRIHRIGQSDNCFYYILVCKRSLEEDILQTLEMRKDYNDELFKEYEKN